MSKNKIIKEGLKHAHKAEKRFGDPAKAEHILDKDRWVFWDDVVKEHRYDRCVMANNYELRKNYNMQKRSGTHQARGMTKERKFRHIAAIPTWLWMRMEILTNNPDFWKDEKNLKEVLRKYPEYALVDINSL